MLSLRRRCAASSALSKLQEADTHSFALEQDLFRLAFALPEGEEALGEVHAVLTLQGKQEAFVRPTRATD